MAIFLCLKPKQKKEWASAQKNAKAQHFITNQKNKTQLLWYRRHCKKWSHPKTNTMDIFFEKQHFFNLKATFQPLNPFLTVLLLPNNGN